MTKFTNFFTRKRSPFTSSNRSSSNNGINMQENPYARKTSYNLSPLNMKVDPTFEIGEKVSLKTYSIYDDSLYGIIRGIHVQEEFDPASNKMVKYYSYDFESIPSGRITTKYGGELQKTRQDGGNKRRRRSHRRRTYRRKH